ncbi:MAG: hypothetical protein AAF787_00250 [Chloroflexota bacterium]
MSESHPTFDFSTVNREWRLLLMRADTKASRIGRKIDRMNADLDVSEDDIDAAWKAFAEANDHRDTLLCQIIADVPREWLVKDAPASVSFKGGAGLKHLRADRYDELMQLANERMQHPAGKSETP